MKRLLLYAFLALAILSAFLFFSDYLAEKQLCYAFEPIGAPDDYIEMMNRAGDVLAVPSSGFTDTYSAIGKSGTREIIKLKSPAGPDTRLVGFNNRREVAGIYSYEAEDTVKTTVFVSGKESFRQYTALESEMPVDIAAGLDEEGNLVVNRLSPSDRRYDITKAMVLPPKGGPFEVSPPSSSGFLWFEFRQVLGQSPSIPLFGVAGNEQEESYVIIDVEGKVLRELSRDSMEPVLVNDEGAVVYHEERTNAYHFLPSPFDDVILMNFPPTEGKAWRRVLFLNSKGVVAGNTGPYPGGDPLTPFIWSKRTGFQDLSKQLSGRGVISSQVLGLADDNTLLLHVRLEGGKTGTLRSAHVNLQKACS